MDNSYKRLVFNFYATEDFEERISNKIHFNCLNHYSNIFDEAIICISTDSKNEELICKVQNKFSSIIKCKVLTFKTIENSIYGESETFNNEIVKKLSVLEGLTFFGHNKGITNFENALFDKNSIVRWICGSYFYNLEDIKEVEANLIRNLEPLFYGSYLTLDNDIRNKFHAWYAGTFFWLNATKIAEYCKSKDIEIPKITDRFFDELFPGNIIGWNYGWGLGSHNARVLYPKNLYINSYGVTNFLGTEEDNIKFEQFLREMKQDMLPYDYTILTYNFGNYDTLKEVISPQENVEYVCVTDRTDLFSDTWKIIYDESLDGLTSMEKVYRVRYDCFKYCSTNLCVKIDSSIKILNSIDKLIKDFGIQDKRIAVLSHFKNNTIEEEYNTWFEERNLPFSEKQAMFEYASDMNFDTNIKGIYEVEFMVIKKDFDTIRVNEEMMKALSYFKEKGINIRVDQVLFSLILNNKFNDLNIMPLSHSIIQSNTLRWMIHGDSKYACVVPVVNDEEGYLFNNKHKLYNW